MTNLQILILPGPDVMEGCTTRTDDARLWTSLKYVGEATNARGSLYHKERQFPVEKYLTENNPDNSRTPVPGLTHARC